MLELQKRIKEDYHETLLKRISKREVSICDVFIPKKIHSSILKF